MCKRMNLETYHTSFTKIHIKRMIDLNIRPKIIKPLQENAGENLDNVGFGKDLTTTSKAEVTKVKVDSFDYIKI